MEERRDNTAARQEWLRRARAVQIQTLLNGSKLELVSGELVGPCPVCGGDDRFALKPREQIFNCRKCEKGGKGAIDFLKFRDGLSFNDAAERLAGPPPKANGASREWIYPDAEGRPYLKVVRFDSGANKQYPQYKWDGGQWIKGKPKGPKIPYRLPELLDSDRTEPVYVCEGEKCADAVAGLGSTATSASEGAGKWTADLNEHFRDRIIHILPDNDGPGRKHAATVAANLDGIAKEVRVVALPGLADKEDVFDWIERGGTREQLEEIGETAPI